MELNSKSENFVVTTFYKFVDIAEPDVMRAKLYKFCKQNDILGTVLLAAEGVNSTMVASADAIKALQDYLHSLPEFSDMVFKDSICTYAPFKKLKIKVKKEIIKFGVDGLDGKKPGVHLTPKEFEDLIDSGAMVIDTRNDYEVEFGTFKNAVNPHTRNFTDLIEWVDKNLKDKDKDEPIGMFCTGGVRCEKSTAYLLSKGFKNVYHLNGGVIQYFLESDRKKDYWINHCFVFDDRVAVDADLTPYVTDKIAKLNS